MMWCPSVALARLLSFKGKGRDVASGSCHPVSSCVADMATGAELSVVSCFDFEATAIFGG